MFVDELFTCQYPTLHMGESGADNDTLKRFDHRRKKGIGKNCTMFRRETEKTQTSKKAVFMEKSSLAGPHPKQWGEERVTRKQKRSYNTAPTQSPGRRRSVRSNSEHEDPQANADEASTRIASARLGKEIILPRVATEKGDLSRKKGRGKARPIFRRRQNHTRSWLTSGGNRRTYGATSSSEKVQTRTV